MSAHEFNIAQSTHECLWFPLATTLKETIPRHDSIICVNEESEIACVVLPEVLISRALAEREQRKGTHFCLVQRIEHNKDSSYLSPVIINEKQSAIWSNLVLDLNKKRLDQALHNTQWADFVADVRANSTMYLNNPSFHHPLRRIEVKDRSNLLESDDETPSNSHDGIDPVFLYTSVDNEITYSRAQLRRELAARSTVADRSLDIIQNEAIGSMVHGKTWLEQDCIQALSRAEAELLLNTRYNILDPEIHEALLEIRTGSEPDQFFKFTQWGEPNIVQILLYCGEKANIIASPTITIINDEIGVHALPTYLFYLSTDLFSEGTTLGEIRLLDDMPASEIPEISWEPTMGDVPQAWWNIDKIAKKVLWLAVRNLCSHRIEQTVDVICSVIPIGDSAVQVAIAENDRDNPLAPYAFLSTSSATEVNATPILTSSSIIISPGGNPPPRPESYWILREEAKLQKADNIIRTGSCYKSIISQKKVPCLSDMAIQAQQETPEEIEVDAETGAMLSAWADSLEQREMGDDIYSKIYYVIKRAGHITVDQIAKELGLSYDDIAMPVTRLMDLCYIKRDARLLETMAVGSTLSVVEAQEKTYAEDVLDSMGDAAHDSDTYTPVSARDHFRQALEYKTKGDYDKSIEGYTEAIKLDGNFWLAYLSRGELFMMQGNKAEAIADFETVINLSDNDQLTKIAKSHLTELNE